MILNFLKKKKIKDDLLKIIADSVDLEKKNISSVHELQKADLDSVELMTVVQKMENRWGTFNLIQLYKATTFDDLIEIIAQK